MIPGICLVGRPEEVAAATAHVISDDASSH
jgi:hypothetical protein